MFTGMFSKFNLSKIIRYTVYQELNRSSIANGIIIENSDWAAAVVPVLKET